MNRQNNSRRQETVRSIRSSFKTLALEKDPEKISVSDICKKAGINRSTFYSIYFDTDDLRSDIEKEMTDEFLTVFPEKEDGTGYQFDFGVFFRHMSENQDFYRLYFRLGFDFGKMFLENEMKSITKEFPDRSHLEYHLLFFQAGMTALLARWLGNGCRETPEEMLSILRDQYINVNIIRSYRPELFR